MREGIWRIPRLLGDGRAGEARAGGGGGVSRAGESCGDSSELISMLAALFVVRCATSRLELSSEPELLLLVAFACAPR